MKIILTGAGGGHFYPLIAVAERVRKEVFVQKLLSPDVYFLSDAPYDERALFDLQIKFIKIPSGKLHVYPSIENVTGILKTILGIIMALKELYRLYPDVVFAKGGYASFPVIFAARMLSIPVVVHESDTVAGRTTKWAGNFAMRTAISYKEAIKSFKEDKTALTGLPIRERILPPENFKRTFPQKDRPVIFILGGSQGSQRINEAMIDMLPDLLNKYDVVHQTGVNNINDIKSFTKVFLKDHPYKDRYYAEGFLDVSLFYPKVDLVITRAGSALFEVALWQLPSIVIPIPETISRDQRSNAYAYARTGCAVVLEENNISKSVMLSSIDNILSNKTVYEQMMNSCHTFDYSRDASAVIARELIRIILSHQ